MKSPEVRDFLVTRRARISPVQAGLTFSGGNRRVAGLRREEVAVLAGVCADCYTRLEKGNLAGVSDSVLDSMTTTAAFVRHGRLDILGTNLRSRALYSPVFDSPTRTSQASPPNLARFGFLDPAALDLFPDYDQSCHTSVAILRTEAGRDPHDRGLSDLVGELTLAFEAMALSADTALTLTAYTAEPDSRSAENLQLLSSWAPTRVRASADVSD